jgi:hypothetical protein
VFRAGSGAQTPFVKASLPAALASVLLAAVLTGSSSAQVPPPQQISTDPFRDTAAQHVTAVEPDTFSFGDTVVAVFQVGRRATGGASGIGYATSRDGGRTWASGVLPVPAEAGLTFVSDPAIAYDRVHGVWIASMLGGRAISDGVATSQLASRSSDGVVWTTTFVDPDRGRALHDKNWIACDNGTASPRAGRCYVAWTAPAGEQSVLGLATSDDGGRTWTSTVFEQVRGFGVFPLVRPDGTLVVIAATAEGTSARIEADSSTDGGRSFSEPATVAALRVRNVPGLRVPPFHSAEISRDGRIVVAWPDCRYRSGCSSNDIVYSSSANGRTWTTPFRVPTGGVLAGLEHVLPGLAVDPTSAAASTKLALAFYVLSPRGCVGAACRFEPYFVSSPDAGRSWSAPEQLEPAAPAEWFPLAGARFAGDYISTSFVGGGTAVPVFAWASAPFDGQFHEGVYATAIAPLPATPAVQLGVPRVRVATRLEVRASARPVAGSRVVCRATVGRRALKLVSARSATGTATCTWRRARGRVTGSLQLIAQEGTATRAFSARVR